VANTRLRNGAKINDKRDALQMDILMLESFALAGNKFQVSRHLVGDKYPAATSEVGT